MDTSIQCIQERILVRFITIQTNNVIVVIMIVIIILQRMQRGGGPDPPADIEKLVAYTQDTGRKL